MSKPCPYCMAYLLDHQTLMGWKRCPNCAYCEDRDGYNLLNPNPVYAQIEEESKEWHKYSNIDDYLVKLQIGDSDDSNEGNNR